MAAWPFPRRRSVTSPPGPVRPRWLEANDAFRKDVLTLLRRPGPLQSRDIPDTSAVPWQSTGWTGNRNVTQMLEFLTARGEVAVAGAAGGSGSGISPSASIRAVQAIPLARGTPGPRRRRLRALGIARRRGHRRQRGAPLRGGRGRAGRGRGNRQAAGSSTRTAFRRRLRGAYGAAVAVRPPDPRPRSRPGALRLRVLPGDVQAGRRSGAGATSRCRSSTTTGWSASSTRSATGRPRSCRPRDPRGRPPHARDPKAVDAEIEALAAWLGVTVERRDLKA